MTKTVKKIIDWYKAMGKRNGSFVYLLAIIPVLLILFFVLLVPGLIGVWALQLLGAPVELKWGSVAGASLIYLLLKNFPDKGD
jgi:hypothetical protein